MEDNAQITNTESDEFSADVLHFAEMFERLSPEARTTILELLRQLNSFN